MKTKLIRESDNCSRVEVVEDDAIEKQLETIGCKCFNDTFALAEDQADQFKASILENKKSRLEFYRHEMELNSEIWVSVEIRMGE